MTSSFDNEYYEDLRDNYADRVSKTFADLSGQYLPSFKKELADINIVCLDDRELLRIAFYIEDIILYNENMENFSFVEWFESNMERNPGFYTRYFRKIKKKQSMENMQPKPDAQLEQEITAKVSPEPQFQSEEERQKAEIDEVFTQLFPVENAQLPLNNEKTIDETLLDVVNEIQQKQKNKLREKLELILSQVSSIDLINKDSVLASLAEITVYKTMLTTMLSLLNIKITSTSFQDGISSNTVSFQANSDYHLDELKRGIVAAKIEIANMRQENDKVIEQELTIRQIESRNKTLQSQTSTLEDRIRKLEQELQKQISKPKIDDAKFLYCYLAWDEINEEGKSNTYYLATSDTEKTELGVYRVQSLLKTTKTKDAIKFANRNDAELQLNKVKKLYSRYINPKSKISLKEHLMKCYLVEYVKNYNKKFAMQPKVIEVVDS